MHHTNAKSPCQKGFTLLELVVVVTIMAIIAGATLTAYQGVDKDAQQQAARYQMRQIADAVEAYFKDGNELPSSVNSPADMSFLFLKDVSLGDWQPDYRTGWRGPYLSKVNYLYVDVGGNIGLHGEDLTNASTQANPGDPRDGTLNTNLINLPDPFTQEPSGGYFQWRDTSGRTDTNINQMGRPYLLIDLEVLQDSALHGIPRIVSLGANGEYDPKLSACDYTETDKTNSDYCTHDDLCTSDGDDIVLCLR